MIETVPHAIDHEVAAERLERGSDTARQDPLAAVQHRLTRWFSGIGALWLAAGLASLLLHLIVEPRKVDKRGDPFSDEPELIARLAATHGAALRDVLDGTLEGPESFAELDRKLTGHKKTLRQLSLVSVQDPWSRDPLILLRRDLIESYYRIQDDLDEIRSQPEGSSGRQKRFREAADRLQQGRRRIVETTRELGIRPQEVSIEDDTRQRIYGIVDAAATGTAPR